ncbi:hypothetical protein ZWY2020_058194 [Hordeum vulgare]|nr:hypothetical protein ZWY2020_058194 [Hordeum vulgare]
MSATRLGAPDPDVCHEDPAAVEATPPGRIQRIHPLRSRDAAWPPAVPPLQNFSRSSDLLRTEMRGVGGPLLTVSDIVSDLAVEGGDDHVDDGGDTSVPSPLGNTSGGGS